MNIDGIDFFMDVELENKIKKKGKHIQVFSDGCDLCQEHIENLEVGKCAGCILEVYPFNPEFKDKNNYLSKYNIAIHPTTIIDNEIKVEGVPSFYWQCGDEFYDKLRQDYPLL